MSKILENLQISGAQLEVLRDSKPYGKAYFDVETGVWEIDFYPVTEGQLMFVRFIKEMLSGKDTHCIDAFEVYSDNLFAYTFSGIGGMYTAGRVLLMPIKNGKVG